MTTCKLAFVILAGVPTLISATPAMADVTGNINATITLESGCSINGENTADGASGVDFGTLDFGTETTLFDEAEGQVIGSVGGIEIQCSVDTAPILRIGAGSHDGQGAGGNKAMQNAANTSQYVGYNLLRDDNATILASGDTITLASDGSVQTVVVYGRAFGATGLGAGTYNDTVTVTIEI